MSAVLSQYVSQGLQRWGIKTENDIEKKYVYLEWQLFTNIQRKNRPQDKSLKYCESEFTKHNHLYRNIMVVIFRLNISLGNRPRSTPSFNFIVSI